MSRFFNKFLSPIRWVWSRNKKHTQPPSTGDLMPQNNEENRNTDEPPRDARLLKLKWANKSTKSIMRSRADMVAVEKSVSLHDLIKVFKETAYSRIPVYNDDLDHIIGIINAKDLLGCFEYQPYPNWHSKIRPAFFVPENKSIDSLFNEFQNRRTHFAIVVNEYGETQGIVTMEDALEELVGEIRDEYDEPNDGAPVQITDLDYVFEARTSIDDACRVLGIDVTQFEEARDGADTLGGLLMAAYGAVPPRDTEIVLNHLKFKVLDASNQRIETIQVTLPK